MLSDGVFRTLFKPDAVIGLHVSSEFETGQIVYRPGPYMASYDDFFITVKGRQTHASLPWMGVDPILGGARVIEALNTIVSRRLDTSENPVVISVGLFRSGIRPNIIPDVAELAGTLRTFDEKVRRKAVDSIIESAKAAAKTVGAEAEVKISSGYGVTSNDVKLTERLLPALREAATGNVQLGSKKGGAEDFSYFANEVPGLFVFLGVTPKEQVGKAAANHSGKFILDEKALPIGVMTMSRMALELLGSR